ncbi:hypothetical protein OsJ_00750 [Oryza sativa Japonica Group]|uniref:Uncharacterized protein n=1 Tax=Oryza sativa subsp. japonica TaxID=39947 RepID=B9ETN5_ORYSJ|nr:hypothetical protein OsJ_00750 [Oryza sativa Japonica Group]
MAATATATAAPEEEEGKRVMTRALEWEGCVVSPVPTATADEAWALLSDFLAFHRWHPRVAKCRPASPSAAASTAAAPPGSVVRYCEGTPRGDGAPPDWAHETLLEHERRAPLFRYEMNDNNMGFGVFVATFPRRPRRWRRRRGRAGVRAPAGLDGMAARVQEHLMSARAADAAVIAAGGVEAADELNRDKYSIAV